MKNRSGRRDFLKKLSAGAVGASVITGTMPSMAEAAKQQAELADQAGRQFNGEYTGEYLSRVAMPIGGMGSGMFCVEGTGAISHMSVRNKPDVFNEPVMFGAVAVKGSPAKAKMLEGPVPDWKGFGLHNAAIMNGGTTYGLPHFEKATFSTRFPFATIVMEENEFPIKAKLRAWSPFIPGDADNSGLPAGAIEYTLQNTTSGPLEGVFSFHSKNFMRVEGEERRKEDGERTR